jgi:hypothetical protein
VVEKGRFELFNTIRICDFLEWTEKYTEWDVGEEFPRPMKSGNNKEIHSHINTPAEQRKPIPMMEPKNKEDSFYVFRDCVRAFEEEHGYTPNETQLWVRLKTTPPKEYAIEWDKKNSCLLMGGDVLWNRESFHKAYERRYPPNPPTSDKLR